MVNLTTDVDSFSDDPNGKCTEDEFDCDDATCISASLKCNGFYNCRFRWDEDNCHGSESWALTDDHIVIIMVIFSLILTGMFFTFIYNCIKKLVRDHQTIKMQGKLSFMHGYTVKALKGTLEKLTSNALRRHNDIRQLLCAPSVVADVKCCNLQVS
ncbi:hypothetical protein D910_07283 [Dendroctonus ponderosae]|uniref:Uncharacterized protein n=1 Tax=Dendroctonus ponderosae TaxID=77166 RepID=U4U7Q1_DENPD|nr:hypothetical protein D910_07283 [Dendroctonus ponderosae]